jgi:hypothetical protein
MATEGYVEASEDIVEMMATEAFLRGCKEPHSNRVAVCTNCRWYDFQSPVPS